MQPFGIAAPMMATARAEPRVAEYTEAGVYDVVLLDDASEIDAAVLIGPGLGGYSVAPFHGGQGGANHWRNHLSGAPRGELVLTIAPPQSANTTGGLVGQSHLMDGSTYLLRVNNATSYYPTLGGGGGDGGDRGNGAAANGGLGGGAGGYFGKGGRGGNYLDTASGQMPEPGSGGGRGGDGDGLPTGYQGSNGEGVGLLGRTPNHEPGSLGTSRFGGGGSPAGSQPLSGGARLVFGGDRTYPDNAPDMAAINPASLVSVSSGVASAGSIRPPLHMNGARPGDLAILAFYIMGNGGISMASDRWHSAGQAVWKQLTSTDLIASSSGTLSFASTADAIWVSCVFRGAMIARARSQASAASDIVAAPGFVKRIDSRRLFAIALDREPGADLNLPEGFTSRALVTGSNGRLRVGDAPPSAYTDGADLLFTGMGATDTGAVYVVELF